MSCYNLQNGDRVVTIDSVTSLQPMYTVFSGRSTQHGQEESVTFYTAKAFALHHRDVPLCMPMRIH